ncbi:MAG: PAS domain S-box protein [Burkholderiaceae bacterium]|nr:PAS domain S-box protein [Burkholderiaceae bacterium]
MADSKPAPSRPRRGPAAASTDLVSESRLLAVADPRPRVRRPVGIEVTPAAQSGPVWQPPNVSFFEHSSDAIVRFDRKGQVVYANAALEKATALPRVAFIGRRLAEVDRFADYVPLWEAELAEAFDTLDHRWFKFSYRHPTGRKQFDVRLMVETDPSGQATHATAVLRDVTVPRAAIRSSRAADDFVQTVLAAVPSGIAILDRDLRYQAWNEFLERLLALPADAVLGRRPDEIDSFGGNPEVMRDLLALRDGGVVGAKIAEYQFAPAAGGPWLRVTRTPVYGQDGRFTGVFVTVEQIDRERFAETSLAALRQALDSAGEMVLEIQRDGSVVDANETALAWLGYGRERIKGLALAQIDVLLTPERYADILQELSTRGAYHCESRYRTRLGSEFPVDLVLQRVEQGGREFIFLLVRDITERKRIEARLADAASRFKTIFEESPVANMLLGPGFRVAQVNTAACELLGRTPEHLVGLQPSALLVQGEIFEQLRERLLAGELSAGQSDVRLRHKDGHLLWSRITLRAWYTGEGVERRRDYLLVLEDATERKTSEEHLRSLLADQQTLLETMSVGVAQSHHGRIMLANREFAQMFGYGDGEVVGMSLWELARDRSNRMPNEVSGMPVVRAHQTTSAEVVLFRKDGEPVWCLVQARPVEPKEGGDTDTDAIDITEPLAEAIYTFQDVSEMKRQREALARSLLELNVVLDTTAVALLHLDDGRVVRTNAQAAALFGTADRDSHDSRESREPIGRRFSNLFADEGDHRIHATVMRSTLSAGEVYSFEAQLLGGATRAPFWALLSVRAVDKAAPAKAQIVSILDISARKRQEAQLQTLLAESRLMFDTALVGLLFVRDGRPLRANAAMEELLACERGALTDQGQLFAHPTDQLLAANLAEHYEEIASDGACEFELYMFRRKGDPIWVTVQGRAVNWDRPELGYIFAFVNIDERKRSERELRGALGELQLMFDNALVGMAYVADELVVKANAATERMFGYPAGDLSELEIATLFADRRDWASIRQQALGGEASFEHRMRRADGSSFWCAVNVRPLDTSVPERGLMLALMDVDVRRRSEDELMRVRNYLDLVVENLPVLVSVRDVETGRFVSLNRAGEQITGLARAQVIGRTWHEIYGRQFADLYAEMDRKALSLGQQIDRPRDLMLRADGRTLTVNQRVLPLYEPGGGPADAARARYVMSIIDDLTEEVRAEAALRETETRFRQFAENIDQLVFIATADLTQVLYVNPRYEAVLGGPVEQMLENPRSVLSRVHFDDAPLVARRLPRLVASMRRLQKAELTVRIDHPQRGLRVLNVRLNPVRMFDGSVRVFGVADDVTDRVAAERERIAEAIKQRDILVREVHHRIKNNLQGVAGLLQHMAGAKPEVAEQLEEIASQIQAIAQVHGLQIRASGTLPVLGVVQGIFVNLSNMFGVQIKFEPPASAMWRWGLPEGEAVPLALVVNELGTNAIKYRASRELPIQVQLLPRPDGLELRIENAGTLEPGFDLSKISSSVSGLGLVKALLPRRGARLAIEPSGTHVVTRVELVAPAIREDL